MKISSFLLLIMSSAFATIGQPCLKSYVIKSDTIFVEPDKVAQPEHGLELYMGWMSNNMDKKLKSPEGALKTKVFVSFAVDEYGRVLYSKVEVGGGNAFDREALRLIEKHPHKWIPAQCGGKNVKSRRVMVVTF